MLRDIITIIDMYVHKSLLRDVINQYNNTFKIFWVDGQDYFIYYDILSNEELSMANYRYLNYNYSNAIPSYKRPVHQSHRWVYTFTGENGERAALPNRYYYSLSNLKGQKLT
jgi:hypothetical protein